ncbi:hypothetical protein BsWGS_06552 [Bradybaena similaris]
MGACYSKSNAGTRTHSESKASKQKHKNSDQNNKQNDEELSPESTPLKNDEQSDSPNATRTSRLLSYDIVPDISYVKHLDHSIAPSDSGIESIGTWQDDSQEPARIKQFDSDLLRHSEQWSLSFCHDCGHDKLQSHNMMTDSNSLCCANQTEKSASSSQLLAHGLPAIEGTVDCNAGYDSSGKVIAENAKNGAIGGSCEFKSGLDMSNVVSRDRHLIVSLKSAKRSSRNASAVKLCDSFADGLNETRAPLAQPDPLDRPLSGTLEDKISKQQALLNDISLTAETIVTCDYDADYHRKYSAAPEGAEYGVKSTTHNATVEEKDDFKHSKIKTSSLSRSGSCAYDREVNIETAVKLPSPIMSTSTEINTTHPRSSFSEPTSGVCTHNTASESLLTDIQQDSVVFDAVEDVLDFSSSECRECGTEDDMASIDMDNISRQLVAHSEPATSQCHNNIPNGEEGEDSVVIPKETYDQMQTDLSVLRQQLLCLSSLIEQSECEDQNNVSVADNSH